MLFSYRKVFPDTSDDEAPVRYIKAALPQSLKAQLYLNNEFRDAKNEKELRHAASLYDKMRTVDKSTNSNRINDKDLVILFKEVLTGIRQDNENSCKAIVAAIHERDKSSKIVEQRTDNNERGRSPARFVRQDTSQRTRSPHFYRRSPSPRRVIHQAKEENRIAEAGQANTRKETPGNEQAFNTEEYYAKFGRPLRTCTHCAYWHWDRHCPKNLN